MFGPCLVVVEVRPNNILRSKERCPVRGKSFKSCIVYLTRKVLDSVYFRKETNFE